MWREGGRLGVHANQLVEIGIVRAPDEVAGTDARQVHDAIAEAQFAAIDLENASAFLVLFGTAPIRGVEYDAVTRL